MGSKKRNFSRSFCQTPREPAMSAFFIRKDDISAMQYLSRHFNWCEKYHSAFISSPNMQPWNSFTASFAIHAHCISLFSSQWSLQEWVMNLWWSKISRSFQKIDSYIAVLFTILFRIPQKFEEISLTLCNAKFYCSCDKKMGFRMGCHHLLILWEKSDCDLLSYFGFKSMLACSEYI